MLIFLAFFLAFAFASHDVPHNYFCRPLNLSPERWSEEFPASYKFMGFFTFTGAFYVPLDNFDLIKAIEVTGLWHQYFDPQGVLRGDTYIKGFPGAPPDIQILVNSMSIHPVPGTSRICQNVTFSVEPGYINDFPYSEISPSGVGHMSTAYYFTRPEVFGRVPSSEVFSWDFADQTAFSLVTSILPGVGHDQHKPGLIAYFRYDKVTDINAVLATGFVANPPVVKVGKTFKAGMLHIPVEVLPENARARVP